MSASTSKNFVFKFEFIVHLQTTKFIVEEGYAKSETIPSFLFRKIFPPDTNFESEKKNIFYWNIFFPREGLDSKINVKNV